MFALPNYLYARLKLTLIYIVTEVVSYNLELNLSPNVGLLGAAQSWRKMCNRQKRKKTRRSNTVAMRHHRYLDTASLDHVFKLTHMQVNKANGCHQLYWLHGNPAILCQTCIDVCWPAPDDQSVCILFTLIYKKYDHFVYILFTLILR